MYLCQLHEVHLKLIITNWKGYSLLCFISSWKAQKCKNRLLGSRLSEKVTFNDEESLNLPYSLLPITPISIRGALSELLSYIYMRVASNKLASNSAI